MRLSDLEKQKENEMKLQMLREKLQAGEGSPLVKKFNRSVFIAELHSKYFGYEMEP